MRVAHDVSSNPDSPMNTQNFTPRKIGSHPVLGDLYPDPFANKFGTGFCRFYGRDFDGLARQCGKCLDILAIVSNSPGHGNFRFFVTSLQSMHPEIRFYEVMNKGFYTHLRSIGFNDFDEWGVEGPNVIWERKKL